MVRMIIRVTATTFTLDNAREGEEKKRKTHFPRRLFLSSSSVLDGKGESFGRWQWQSFVVFVANG